MYCPSSNPSVEGGSSSDVSPGSPPLLPYDNYLQHRARCPADTAASAEAVRAHREALAATIAHKANSSDRFLLSAQEREAMMRAAAVRDELRAASEKRTTNATSVMEDAARTRARNVDTANSNNGCADVWDFGCAVDIFQAACDGDVVMLDANLRAAAAEVEAAVIAVLSASRDVVTDSTPPPPPQRTTSPKQDDDEREEGEDEGGESDATNRPMMLARAAAIAASPRVALAANLINAVGQPHAKTYNGVQFEKRWTFQAPPLALAAAFNRERAVKALLTWGADPQQTSSTGLTALNYAQQRGYDVIVEMLTNAMQRACVDTNTSDLTPNSRIM